MKRYILELNYEGVKTLNDVEIMDDFIKQLKKTYPKIQLDQRDELLINMAINHTLLCKKQNDKM